MASTMAQMRALLIQLQVDKNALYAPSANADAASNTAEVHLSRDDKKPMAHTAIACGGQGSVSFNHEGHAANASSGGVIRQMRNTRDFLKASGYADHKTAVAALAQVIADLGNIQRLLKKTNLTTRFCPKRTVWRTFTCAKTICI